MKRHESRNISRSRFRIKALGPCQKYSDSAGMNPFAYLFQKVLAGQEITAEEKQLKHQLKMQADQKSAKARQNRKRNKV